MPGISGREGVKKSISGRQEPVAAPPKRSHSAGAAPNPHSDPPAPEQAKKAGVKAQKEAAGASKIEHSGQVPMLPPPPPPVAVSPGNGPLAAAQQHLVASPAKRGAAECGGSGSEGGAEKRSRARGPSKDEEQVRAWARGHTSQCSSACGHGRGGDHIAAGCRETNRPPQYG